VKERMVLVEVGGRRYEKGVKKEGEKN